MLKAILIDCISPSINKEESFFRMQEAENLIKTFGGIILIKKVQKKIIPNYKTYIGSGKVEELLEEGKELGATILIVNNELKPRQIFNLSEIARKKGIEVWDRIDLILKIFQKNAHTTEAKLEIQMASIKHMGPRIFGMGMELSRQGGGIGTRGIGETNTEFMKRHLFKMENSIKKDLEACKKVRKLHREGRKRKNLKTVSVVGYTNAGKSSLLNALTHKGAYTADKLFATLDTRVGKMYLNGGTDDLSGREILISDTIGFIQDLPPTLIKSFESTLEESIEADLLLHVIDLNDPKMEQKIKVVNEILAQIEALHKPTIYVFNKKDLMTGDIMLEKFESELTEKYAKYNPVFVSTVSGEGVEELKRKIGERV